MLRKVEGLENFKKILELPIGSRFGLFVSTRIDDFMVTSYLGQSYKTNKSDEVSTVLIPTYPMVRFDHANTERDLVFEDPSTGLARILYESDLKGPIRGIPWKINRAVILPRYLYEAGAAPCFDTCFIFVNAPIGYEVNSVLEYSNTATFFISIPEIKKQL